jgi:hypothetical protein
MEGRRRSSISVLPSNIHVGTGEVLFRSLSRTFINTSHHDDDIELMQGIGIRDDDSAKTKVND